jgi:transposase-like protein
MKRLNRSNAGNTQASSIPNTWSESRTPEAEMTGHGAKFGRKKEQAVAALLSQRSIEEAARATGVSERTLRRWLQIPEFRDFYRQARGETVTQAAARLQLGSGAAATTLLKVMLDPNVPASSKVRAAQCVLELGLKGLELEDLEIRIARLEASERDSKPRRNGGWQ